MPGWNFADIWESLAHSQPTATALLHQDREVSWQDFDSRADGLAQHLLNAGLSNQDKVGFYLYNGPEYMETFFACSKASLVHVNTNFRYGPNEIRYLWDNADIAAVIFHGCFSETIEKLLEESADVRTWLWVDDESGPCPDWATPYEDATATPNNGRVKGDVGRSGDDLILLYTGGTTGMPKGVMWRQEDLILVSDSANSSTLPLTPDLDDDGNSATVINRAAKRQGPISIPVCPLMHGTGLFNALTSLCLGGAISTLSSRKLSIPELLDTIVSSKAKSIFIVGDAFAQPILAALDAEPKRWDLASLRVILSSGVMWGKESKDGLLGHYPNLILVDSYGSSEAIGVGSSVSTKGPASKTASFSLTANSVVIADDNTIVEPGSGVIGRIGIRGYTPIGYYKDEEKSALTFPTVNGVRYSIPGDHATVEADGTITLLGRGSVCINTAGEKVFPEEVEEVLKRFEGISDAIVVGVPDKRFGQRVAAVVAAQPGLVAKDAIDSVKADLAGYKAPRELYVVDSLERAANGKIDYARWTEYATEQTSD